MFSKLVIPCSIALLAVATPTPGGSGGSAPPASQCNTAPVQCCNSVQSAGSPAAVAALAAIPVVVQDVNIPIGLGCSPISVVGVGSGATCGASPVCCENNSFNGVVAIGCTPVNLSL